MKGVSHEEIGLNSHFYAFAFIYRIRICKRTHFLHFGVSIKSSNIFRSNLT